MRRIARTTLLALGTLPILAACHDNHVCVPASGISESAPVPGLWVSTYEQHCLIGRGTVDVSVDSGGSPTGSGNVFSAAVSSRRYRGAFILDMVNARWADSATLIVSYSAALDVRYRADSMPGFRVVFKPARASSRAPAAEH